MNIKPVDADVSIVTPGIHTLQGSSKIVLRRSSCDRIP
jgi:hypothetical protein